MSNSIIQIGDQSRLMTDEELAEWQKGVDEDKQIRQKQQALKQSGYDKLIALGLTDDEIKAILGA